MRKCISCNIGCADHRIARSLSPAALLDNPDIIHGDVFTSSSVSHENQRRGDRRHGRSGSRLHRRGSRLHHLAAEEKSRRRLASTIALLPEKNGSLDFRSWRKPLFGLSAI